MSSFFDVPGRTFDFKNDLLFGLSGESLFSKFLDSLEGGDFEIKSDRYRNGRMVVETEQNPRGRRDQDGNQVWVKSGINITTAKWWVYMYSPEGAFVTVLVDRMKRYLRINNDKFNDTTKKDFGGPSNPARGFLIYPEDVLDMLINPRYDEPKA
jgi:hypothetical protein